jgi:hypothetical protein
VSAFDHETYDPAGADFARANHRYWLRVRLRALAANPACPARAQLQDVADAPADDFIDDVLSFRHDLALLSRRLDEILHDVEKAARVSARGGFSV